MTALEHLDDLCHKRKAGSVASVDDTKPPAWALNIDVLADDEPNDVPPVHCDDNQQDDGVSTQTARTTRTTHSELKALFPPGLLPFELDPWADEIYDQEDRATADQHTHPRESSRDAGPAGIPEDRFQRPFEAAEVLQTICCHVDARGLLLGTT